MLAPTVLLKTYDMPWKSNNTIDCIFSAILRGGCVLFDIVVEANCLNSSRGL